MTFEDARASIFAALHKSHGLLNDPLMDKRSRNPLADVSFDELELDSLEAMEFCLNVEDNVGLRVELGELLLHPSVNALAAALAERTSPA